MIFNATQYSQYDYDRRARMLQALTVEKAAKQFHQLLQTWRSFLPSDAQRKQREIPVCFARLIKPD